MFSFGLCVTKANLYYTQARKQTNGDPSGVNWIHRGITCLYKFKTPCDTEGGIYRARIVARLLNIYQTVKINLNRLNT